MDNKNNKPEWWFQSQGLYEAVCEMFTLKLFYLYLKEFFKLNLW